MNFYDLFNIQNNMITPKVVIYINGVTMSDFLKAGDVLNHLNKIKADL